MYYEETVINGVTCYRTTPTGEWKVSITAAPGDMTLAYSVQPMEDAADELAALTAERDAAIARAEQAEQRARDAAAELESARDTHRRQMSNDMMRVHLEVDRDTIKQKLAAADAIYAELEATIVALADQLAAAEQREAEAREALERIQSQCAGHADEFSRQVWVIAQAWLAKEPR